MEDRIKRNLDEINENIRRALEISGRKYEDVKLVGVTKTVPYEVINHSIDLGIKIIGENRVQEFLSKYDYLKKDNIECHIIGTLQKNKVKYICDKVSMIQSVNSVELINKINSECEKKGKVMNCLVEINIDNEDTKTGIGAENVDEILEAASKLSFVKVKGLMCIPAKSDDERTIRNNFADLYKIYIDKKAQNMDNIDMDILSMGMSHDYYYALAEGANMVRIGTALYGQR